ncbi:MAG: asparagine synthase (glutamine-hydrolyzing), partial [Urechidicola sp.]
NYKELQKKYQIAEGDLRSSSDSEVLAHLIEKVDVSTFASELNGMFAISIWNIKKKEVYLIRDFSGIKPLYYGLHSEGVVFASQFNQVFQHPAFSSKKIRPEIMKEFLGLGYMHAPNTIFENIYQVEPGQYVVWDVQSNTITKKIHYFDWEVTATRLDDLEETREQFSVCFENVVKHQLQSDVPVATFLSSGYDSSLVTAYAKKHKNDLRAFTFGVDDPNLNEADSAKEYAKILKVSHIIEQCKSEELLNIVEEHFSSMPEPLGDFSSIPTYLITQKAKQYATVMLSGDGGDELFWGYPRFRKSVNQGHWFKYPLWLRKIIIPFFRKNNKLLSRSLEVLPNFSDWILEKQIHFTGLDKLISNHNFSKELIETYKFKRTNNKQNILLYLKENEFYAHLQRTLRKVDLMSMANSLEVRVPFLDKNMIQFSNTIIPQFRIKHDRPKLILKDDLYQYINIDKVSKEKKGFSVPIEKWLKNELKDDFLNTVMKTPIYGKEHLDIKFLHTLVDDFYQNKRKINPWGLWNLYAWQKWAINNNLI